MVLKEKEKTAIQDLQTQEQTCIEKYGKYSTQAKDPVLKDLFKTLQQKEQQHYDSYSRYLTARFLPVTAMTTTEKNMIQKQHMTQ